MTDPNLPRATLADLQGVLRVGDLVFTRIPFSPFRQIAAATGTWTNPVGVVVDVNNAYALVAESRLPLSCRTRFACFARRSAERRVAVLRLRRPVTDREVQRLQQAAARRLGRLYDTGFNLR